MPDVSIDSYLGQIGNSFYGGPNGISFEIKKVFTSKLELSQDAAAGIDGSPVQIGEYALVSYGDLNSSEYEENKAKDAVVFLVHESPYSTSHTGDTLNAPILTSEIDIYVNSNQVVSDTNLITFRIGSSETDYYTNKNNIRIGSYDGTLWQKILTSSGDVSYEELTSLQGQGTSLNITGETLPANTLPSVYESPESVYDNKHYIIGIPKAWDISIAQADDWSSADTPITFNPTPTRSSDTITWTVNKPRAHSITLGAFNAIYPGNSPSVSITVETDQPEGVETSQINFDLPKAWGIETGVVAETTPSQPPSVTINQYADNNSESELDLNTKYVHFNLPKPWSVGIIPEENWSPATTPIALSAQPIIDDDTLVWTVNKPRAHSITLGAVESINPNGTPTVSMTISALTPGDEDGIETKYINFSLPKQWAFSVASTFTAPGTNCCTVTLSTINNDTQRLNFTLPKTWNMSIGTVTTINPGATPTVTINQRRNETVTTDSNDTKYVHFQLPNAWDVKLGVTSITYPSDNPSITVNTSSNDPSIDDNRDGETKYIHFVMPTAQSFTVGGATITSIGPNDPPVVSIQYAAEDNIHKNPIIQMNLPRPAKTYYGTALQIAQSTIVDLNNITAQDRPITTLPLQPGDYYINNNLGAIHKIITVDQNQIATQYEGFMQLSLPSIITGATISPYDQNGNPQAARITLTSTSVPTTTWSYTYSPVAAPKINITGKVIGGITAGSFTVTYNENGLDCTATIPKGTAIFTGNSTPTITAYKGDLWINNNTGWLNKYNEANQWQRETALKGDSFLVRNSIPYSITIGNISSYTIGTDYQKMGQYLDSTTSPTLSTVIKGNEVVAVEYTDDQDATGSYWLYRANNDWNGSKLTGDLATGFLEHALNFADPRQDKTYDEFVINDLADRITALEASVTTLWEAFETAWGPLSSL